MPWPVARPKPIVDRVRADGPLLPPLTLALARWIADALPRAAGARHPVDASAGSARAARARRRADAGGRQTLHGGSIDAVDRDLLDQLAVRRAPGRDLAAPDGRAGLLRRLRASWPSATSSRSIGRCSVRPPGRATSAGPAAPPPVVRRRTRSPTGERPPVDRSGRARSPPWPSSPRRSTALPAADVAGRHGTAAVAGLVRRGLVEAETRERPRRPLAARPAGLRGGRPPAAPCLPSRRRRSSERARGDRRPRCDGRSCSTA